MTPMTTPKRSATDRRRRAPVGRGRVRGGRPETGSGRARHGGSFWPVEVGPDSRPFALRRHERQCGQVLDHRVPVRRHGEERQRLVVARRPGKIGRQARGPAGRLPGCPQPGQRALLAVAWSGSRYPIGRYTVLWEGKGRVGFPLNRVSVHRAEPNRIVVDVTGDTGRCTWRSRKPRSPIRFATSACSGRGPNRIMQPNRSTRTSSRSWLPFRCCASWTGAGPTGRRWSSGPTGRKRRTSPTPRRRACRSK